MPLPPPPGGEVTYAFGSIIPQYLVVPTRFESAWQNLHSGLALDSACRLAAMPQYIAHRIPGQACFLYSRMIVAPTWMLYILKVECACITLTFSILAMFAGAGAQQGVADFSEGHLLRKVGFRETLTLSLIYSNQRLMTEAPHGCALKAIKCPEASSPCLLKWWTLCGSAKARVFLQSYSCLGILNVNANLEA